MGDCERATIAVHLVQPAAGAMLDQTQSKAWGLLPVFGLGGSIYLVGAAALGAWLIGSAYRVWRQEGNKVAWKMYRHSSMYLAFLFLVLMVDALL